MIRRIVTVWLVALNAALLAVLVLRGWSPPAALAQQAAAPGGQYVLIAAQAEVANDAIYVLDAAANQLQVYRTTYPHFAGQPVRVARITTRDLARDFGRQEAR